MKIDRQEDRKDLYKALKAKHESFEDSLDWHYWLEKNNIETWSNLDTEDERTVADLRYIYNDHVWVDSPAGCEDDDEADICSNTPSGQCVLFVPYDFAEKMVKALRGAWLEAI